MIFQTRNQGSIFCLVIATVAMVAAVSPSSKLTRGSLALSLTLII